MYLADQDLELGTLRQGDILSKVVIMGALNYNNLSFENNIEGEATSWAYKVLQAPKFCDAMVLSHSCEIAKENGAKVTSIILAPIRGLSGATGKDNIEILKTSNIITDQTTASFLKYFYIEKNQKLMIQNEDCIVDFSKCFSVRNQSYQYLLDRKILQVNNQIQSAIAKKLAIYFYRENAS